MTNLNTMPDHHNKDLNMEMVKPAVHMNDIMIKPDTGINNRLFFMWCSTAAGHVNLLTFPTPKDNFN